ncbi:hypothetical protein ACJ41O_006168 [Fusarium nematophilum]
MEPSKLYQTWIIWILILVSSAECVKVRGNGVEYLGVQNKTSGINNFRGIKYAQAPVGNLRWRAPVPIRHRKGSKKTINATLPGPACWQSQPGWRADTNFTIPQDEDCLLLDVQVPSNPVSDKLPVLVLIHGGGYLAGSTYFTSGDSLVHQSNGSMIFVSLQYRLGALGFLGGDDIKKDGTWNAGLLDQRAGLEWVRNNIQHFGGDPSKITITGSSAGGGSVALQMILYGGKPKNPPFQAAMPEFPWWTPMYDDAWFEKQYSGFQEAADCSSLDCLRKLPISAIQAATRKASVVAYADKQFAFGNFYWSPAIDGEIIQENLQEGFRQGRFTKVPTLVDRNFDEGFIFSNYSIATEEEAISDLSGLWHDEKGYYADIVWKLYPESAYNASHLDDLPAYDLLRQSGAINRTLTDSFIRRSALFGDAIVACPSMYMAEAVAEAGLPAYKLIFNSGYQFHSATEKFLYNNYTNSDGSRISQGTPIPGNAALATLIRNYFISFTLFHDPNTLKVDDISVPSWPKYERESPSVIFLADSGVKVISDPEVSDRCPVFRSGPDRLVFNSSKALQDIYNNEEVTKSDVYLVTLATTADIVGLLAFGFALNSQTEDKYQFLADAITFGNGISNVKMQLPILNSSVISLITNLVTHSELRKFYKMLELMISTRLAKPKDADPDLYAHVADQLEETKDVRMSDVWAEAMFFFPAG